MYTYVTYGMSIEILDFKISSPSSQALHKININGHTKDEEDFSSITMAHRRWSMIDAQSLRLWRIRKPVETI